MHVMMWFVSMSFMSSQGGGMSVDMRVGNDRHKAHVPKELGIMFMRKAYG